MNTPAKRPGRGVRKTGRPSLLTEERIERICQAVRAGATRHHAAAFTGISRATLQEWLARGHAGEQPYADFLHRIDVADGTAVVASATKITTSDDWRAHAWLLERKDPAYRRPPEQVEMSNPDGSLRPVGQVVIQHPDAQRLIRELSSIDEPAE